jgi:hypothetical protein
MNFFKNQNMHKFKYLFKISFLVFYFAGKFECFSNFLTIH